MEKNSDYLTGSFRDRSSAERAYNRLRERGYTDEEINIIMSDETRTKYFDKKEDERDESDFGNKAMEGAGTGSAIGGAVGATAGIIAALGTSLIIPGLGIVIAGPIAAGLAGAGAGGITGGIVGALVGAGIPKDRAEKHEKDIKEGDIVMGVRPRNDEDASYFENDWRQYQGNVYR
ncbi:MAG TPA: hypothetical protein VHO50_14035 [Bacteroidales bacterium]|nr:hypothetical protein [Bacteroidales bacterium]